MSEIETRLRETFAAHEHLADPDRAVAIATAPGSRPHKARVLLGAAAAVALVAAGTTYAVSRGAADSSGPVSNGPELAVHQPPLPPRQSDAVNRAKAVAAALSAIVRVPAYPGARRSGPLPDPTKLGLLTSGPPGHTVERTRWWVVSGAGPSTVAHWYAARAIRGFHTDGSVSSSSSSSPGSPTVTAYAVDYVQPGSDRLPRHGVSIEVETMRVSGGTAVRATALSIWSPARPPASFVQDVTSIDVQSVHRHYGRQMHTTRRSFTMSAPGRVLAAASAYDALPGMTPVVMSCPMQVDVHTDRIVFHTATGDVTAVSTSSNCGSGMVVRRDGRVVPPQLGDATRLLAVLGLAH